MLRQSAFKTVARSVASSAPAAAQRRAMTSARAPSASASSSSSSSRATRATVLFGAGVGSIALALAATKHTPIHNETSAQGSTAVPPKRLTWIERAKANKGGVIVIPRAAIEEEEAEEEEEDDGQVAIEADEVETLSPSGTLESDSVETIAAVVSEDPGASAGSEEEEEDQGAYDPKTGTINWDCPCLGGMAHGPCGEHFKAAFSCFIYSEGEPKGIECVDKFKAMQDCFRAHPEVYSEELEMDEQDELESLIEETETALGIERLVKEEQALGAQQTVVS